MMVKEFIGDEQLDKKIDFVVYGIQWYSKDLKQWLSISNNVWLESYVFPGVFNYLLSGIYKEDARSKELNRCFETYGIDGILDKNLAIAYLNDLRTALKNKDKDLSCCEYMKVSEIKDFRLCEYHYKINSKILDL